MAALFLHQESRIFTVCSKMTISDSAARKVYTVTKTLVRFRLGQGFPDHILLLSENVDSLKLHLLFTS